MPGSGYRGIFATGGFSPFALNLVNSQNCINIGCSAKQCLRQVSSCGKQNPFAQTTTAPPTTTTTTTTTTAFDPYLVSHAGTDTDKLECVESVSAAKVTNPLSLFYAILLIITGLINTCIPSQGTASAEEMRAAVATAQGAVKEPSSDSMADNPINPVSTINGSNPGT